jgi:hypothetical protein
VRRGWLKACNTAGGGACEDLWHACMGKRGNLGVEARVFLQGPRCFLLYKFDIRYLLFICSIESSANFIYITLPDRSSPSRMGGSSV